MAAATFIHMLSCLCPCWTLFSRWDAGFFKSFILRAFEWNEHNTPILKAVHTNYDDDSAKKNVRLSTSTMTMNVQQWWEKENERNKKKHTLHNLFICIYFFFRILFVSMCVFNCSSFARWFDRIETWISSLSKHCVQWYLFAHSELLAQNTGNNNTNNNNNTDGKDNDKDREKKGWRNCNVWLLLLLLWCGLNIICCNFLQSTQHVQYVFFTSNFSIISYCKHNLFHVLSYMTMTINTTRSIHICSVGVVVMKNHSISYTHALTVH